MIQIFLNSQVLVALHFIKLFQIELGKYLSSCSKWITCLTIIVSMYCHQTFLDKLLNHVCVFFFRLALETEQRSAWQWTEKSSKVSAFWPLRLEILQRLCKWNLSGNSGWVFDNIQAFYHSWGSISPFHRGSSMQHHLYGHRIFSGSSFPAPGLDRAESRCVEMCIFWWLHSNTSQ